MKYGVILCMGVVMFICGWADGADTLLERASGAWLFEDAGNPLAAGAGNPLELVGDHEVVKGPGGKPAARIGAGSHYRLVHGMPPNGGGAKINRYTLVMDVRCSLEERFYALMQTDPENRQDNVFEIMNRERVVGSSATGRSRVGVIEANGWNRIAMVVDNAAGLFDVYVNGKPVLKGTGQEVDGRYSLDAVLLLFADDDGEDHTVDVARLLLFDAPLNPTEIEALNSELPLCGDMPAPGLAGPADGPAQVETDAIQTYRFAADKAGSEFVQFRLDWEDDHVDPWSVLSEDAEKLRVRHTFSLPGTKSVRVQLRNECGNTSEWLPFMTVQVTGAPVVKTLTPVYRQNLRTDGITLMWESNVNLQGSVQYGRKGSPLDSLLEANITPSGFGTFIYRAELNGLDAGAEYAYEARLAETYAMGAGAFRTAPAAFEPFMFSVWSDSQGHNKGAYEDDPLEPTISMMRNMAERGVNIAVTTGDLAEDGASYFDTRQFFLDRVATHLGTKVPYFIAWGNHDSYQGAAIRKFADMPSKHRPGFDPGYGAFAFTYAECRFICLDYASMPADIANWLEPELQSDASRNARHRFLFVHVPPYGELWIDGHAELREKLVPLLEKYGVAACFSGHTHAYERGYKNGVHYIVTGGGSWLDHGEEVVKEWPHFVAGGKIPVGGFEHGLVNQYMLLHVDENGWRAECLAFNPDGSEIGVIDTFSSEGP